MRSLHGKLWRKQWNILTPYAASAIVCKCQFSWAERKKNRHTHMRRETNVLCGKQIKGEKKNNFMSIKYLLQAGYEIEPRIHIKKKDIECSEPVCHDLDIYIGEYVIQMLTAINIPQTELQHRCRNMRIKFQSFSTQFVFEYASTCRRCFFVYVDFRTYSQPASQPSR